MPKILFYVGGCNRAGPPFPTANAKGISAFRLDTETGAVEAVRTGHGGSPCGRSPVP